MFATIYGMNELSKKHLGIQENILCSLRFFYVYYYKKHIRTFDYDFYRSGYNISCFITQLDGFFTYLLGKQHFVDGKKTEDVKSWRATAVFEPGRLMTSLPDDT